jgi:hypothetical protein
MSTREGQQDPPPPEQGPPEPGPFDLLARFGTAARALAFAEQAMRAAGEPGGVSCYGSEDDRNWWIRTRLPLGAARELAGLAAAELYVRTGTGTVLDRGWGDGPGLGPAIRIPDLTTVPLLELVRVAGLHMAPARPLREAYALLPGELVPGLLQRALDLRLQVTYQLVQLDPLFDDHETARVCHAIRLSVTPPQTALPATMLAALQGDPFALVCRAVEQSLLIGYGTASPLSDRALARLVTAAGDQIWLLAGPPDGCARLTWIGEPVDAANFVRVGPAHALTDLDGTQPYAATADQATRPEPRTLALVRATVREARIDAMLLDDTDLDCLPLLLTGEPLGDIAFLIAGRDRHLLFAPGGLLTELGVGEPLTCIGPGSLYVPVGYRLDPPIGPGARAALFQPDEATAQVILREARLVFELDAGEPVWRLWAGPVPAVDAQLPHSVLTELAAVATEVGEPGQSRIRERPKLLASLRRQAPRSAAPTGWREQAHIAERQRDYIAAAQLYSRHNDPLRAARMWEREAEEKF